MTPMMNTIRANLHFNKFEVGELLFVEYKCPIEQESAGVWTPMDYFVHVLSGRKTWRTTDGTWIAEKGQTLFFKERRRRRLPGFQGRFLRYVVFRFG
ncbi:MAG TPA: hypothetical protein VI585_01040 [Candidatus Binatia bacterium]